MLERERKDISEEEETGLVAGGGGERVEVPSTSLPIGDPGPSQAIASLLEREARSSQDILLRERERGIFSHLNLRHQLVPMIRHQLVPVIHHSFLLFFYALS